MTEVKRIKFLIRGLKSCGACSALIISLLTFCVPHVAFALDDDTYPWQPPAAICSDGVNQGDSTPTPCDDSTYGDYNYGLTSCPSGDGYCSDTLYGYYQEDNFGYQFSNCTSFVAQKIYQELDTDVSGWGDASHWNTAALDAGYTDDSTSSPQVGDIAVWVSGDHVAYVAAVNGSTATFDEYNVAGTGAYTNSYTSSNHPVQATPDYYIHIGTVTPPSATLWGINSSNEAVRYAGNGVWTYEGGSPFEAITEDGSYVAAVSTSGAAETYQGGGTWHTVSGATLTDIAVTSDDTLWGINTSGQAVRYAGGGSWTTEGGGTVKAITADGSYVAAVTTSGAAETYQGSGTWHTVSGATLTDIAVTSSDTLYGINTSGTAVRYAGGGSWTSQGGGSVEAIASDGSYVAAVTTLGAAETYQGGGTWHTVSGATLIDIGT